MAATLRFSILLPTAFVLAAGLSAGACSSDDAGDGDAGASNGKDGGTGNDSGVVPVQKPCDGELEDECGVKCSASKPCADGLYCKSGACTADCTPTGRQCKATEMCDAHGRCMMDDGNIPNPNTMKDGGETCIEQNLQYESRIPTVELLIDRSGSMDANFGGGKDRWNTIRDILVDPTDGFVKKYESRIRFGLALYTTSSSNQCPDLIEVPFSFDNFQEIHDVFMANEIGDNTPTAESVTAVTAKLDAYDEPPIGPKIIVLATDGDPDTCDDPNSNGTEPPRQASLEAVEAAWDKNIATYVISVGPEATITHLQDLARAGQGGDADAEPYEALDSNALSEAFDAILGGVVSCDVDLNGEVAPENAAKGKITIQTPDPAADSGVTMSPPLVYDDPDGYEMPTRSSVRISGEACDTIKNNPDAEVRIEFPCGTVTIVQ